MTGVTLPMLLLQLACGGADLDLTAQMPASLPRGDAVAFNVRFALAPGLDMKGSGVPAPILQIEVPPSSIMSAIYSEILPQQILVARR